MELAIAYLYLSDDFNDLHAGINLVGSSQSTESKTAPRDLRSAVT
jgi:hypothetical protein